MSAKSFYAPVRPPRGSKVSKDTSGRLMHIIAELSVSKNNDDRKRKMSELKKDFTSSDNRLVALIAGDREKLSITMETFSQISAKINTSRRGCRDVKDKIIACQSLLECKREEIKRLWLESVEHTEVLNMLKEIEDLNKIQSRVEYFMQENNCLKATEVLVSSMSLLDGKLYEVDALNDLKAEHARLRKKLHEVLVNEINKHLYMSPPHVFFEKVKSDEMFKIKHAEVKLPVEGTVYDFSQISSYEHLAVLLRCVSMLNSLQETVEIVNHNCSKELIAIVQRSSKLMYEALANSSFSFEDNEPLLFTGSPKKQEDQPQRFLLELLEAILSQFRYVAINHNAFLDILQRIYITKTMQDVTHCFDMADIYSKLQSVVELFISDNLDLHNTAASERAFAAEFSKVPTLTDLSSYFLRKSVTRVKKHSLFNFDSSSHAINKKTYLQEQKNYMKEKNSVLEADRNFLLVAQPTPKNIKIIFKVVRKFISDVEVALRMDVGTHCPLHTFLMDCVKVFLDQLNIEINRLIERTTITLESWKRVTDPNELKLVESRTQVLNSTLELNYSLMEIEELIEALPDYSNHFLQLICNVLQSYLHMCNTAYKSLIFSDAEERIFSVSWARDKDISRLLRSLPNWTNLEIEDCSEETHDFEESPQEIRFRNKEESELLIRNLSCKDAILPCEIITDYSKFRNLALMHESIEWFATRILQLAERLPDFQASMLSLLPDKVNDESDGNIDITVASAVTTKGCLKKLSKDFKDLSDTCLLVLHLEVRAHCFYYLLQLSKGHYINRKDVEEPEPEVIKLNLDLTRIDESVAPILQVKKIRYIFEGLGELLSTILINSVSNIKKINENGVKKMGRNIFAIQQNLAGITMTREVALDRARQYFDLLNHTYQDILNQIVEEGPQFNEHEYSAVIQLLHNSRDGIYQQDSLICYLDKLRQILDEVAVSI